MYGIVVDVREKNERNMALWQTSLNARKGLEQRVIVVDVF